MGIPTPANWRPSDIIRNLLTGKLYFVVHVVKGYATVITSLNDPQELPPTFTLFPRDYDKYAKDTNIRERRGKYERDTINL